MKAVFILLFLTSLPVLAAKIIFASDPYPPLIYQEDGKFKGQAVEILPEILNLKPEDIEYRIYPWKQVLADAEKGLVDMIGPQLLNLTRAKYLVYTEELFPGTISLWFYKGNPNLANFKMQKMNDLKRFTFGQVPGYSFQSEFGNFFDDPKINKVEAGDVEQVLNLLVTNRIDMFLAYDPVIEYYIKKQGRSLAEFGKVDGVNRTRPYVFGISKKSPWAFKVEEINKRILLLKKKFK